MYPASACFTPYRQGIVAAAKRVRSTEGALDAGAADSPVFCGAKNAPIYMVFIVPHFYNLKGIRCNRNSTFRFFLRSDVFCKAILLFRL